VTQRKLTSLTNRLAKSLGIVGWKIQTTLVEKCETENACAETSWEPEWKTAEISILHPDVFKANGLSFTQFLRHELLHIALEGHKPMDHGPYDPPYENALNNIAILLDKK